MHLFGFLYVIDYVKIIFRTENFLNIAFRAKKISKVFVCENSLFEDIGLTVLIYISKLKK